MKSFRLDKDGHYAVTATTYDRGGRMTEHQIELPPIATPEDEWKAINVILLSAICVNLVTVAELLDMLEKRPY